MKKRSFIIMLILVMTCVFGSGLTAYAASTVKVQLPVTYSQTEARSQLSYVNSFRTGSPWYWNSDNTTKTYPTGLGTLKYDYALEKVAMQRAAEIAILFEHERPSGESCFTAYNGVYVSTSKGENIAMGYGSTSYGKAQTMFDLWKEEDEDYAGQGHRRNMLDSGFTAIGVGCVKCNGWYCWVQEFGNADSGTAVTAANDSAGTAYIDVATSYINGTSSGGTDLNSLVLNMGDTADIPTMYSYVYLSCTYMDNYKFQLADEPEVSIDDTSIAEIKNGKIYAKDAGTTDLKMVRKFSGITLTSTVGITVSKPSIANCTVTLASSSLTYTGAAITPAVTVKNGTTTLKEGTDFTVTYGNNTNAGTASAKITGIGSYGGEVTKNYTITEASASAVSVSLSASSFTYDSAEKKPTVTATIGGNRIPSTCYDVTYSNNVNAGTATAKVTFKKNVNGYATKTFTISPLDISKGTLTLKTDAVEYTTSTERPGVSELKVGSVSIIDSDNYTVSYKNADAVGTGTITLTGKNNCTGTLSKNYTIYEGPNITKQPVNAVVGNAGDKAKFTCEAAGTDLTYKWYYSDTGSDYKATTNTTNTYAIEVTEARNGRKMYCQIMDKYGNTRSSYIVTMTIADPPKFVTQPTDAAAMKEGDTVTFTAYAKGTGVTYAWYYRDSTAAAWKKTAVTASRYSIAVTAARDGRQMRCTATDKFGHSVNSSVVTMKIAETAAITAQPKSVAVTDYGDKATLKVTATGDGLTYAWYYRDGASGSFTKTSSTSASYSIPVTFARDGRQMYCAVTDTYGNTVKSSTVTMSVKNALKFTTQPGSVTVTNQGDTAKFTTAASGNGVTYAWYYRDGTSGSFTKTASTSSSYSIPVTAQRYGRQMYCLITDKFGNTVKSNTVTMKYKTPPVITSQPTSVTVAKTGDTATFTVAASGTGLKYAWYYRDGTSGSFTKTAVTTSSYSIAVTSARNGRQMYCLVTDSYGNSVKSATVTMKIK